MKRKVKRSAAQELADKRWARVKEEQRKAHSRMMNAAKAAKAKARRENG